MSQGRKLPLVALILNLIGLVLIAVYVVTSFGKGLIFMFICCMHMASAWYFAALRASSSRNTEKRAWHAP
jgi:hypothetical protein